MPSIEAMLITQLSLRWRWRAVTKPVLGQGNGVLRVRFITL
jgi:hypothetical protein